MCHISVYFSYAIITNISKKITYYPNIIIRGLLTQGFYSGFFLPRGLLITTHVSQWEYLKCSLLSTSILNIGTVYHIYMRENI